MELEPTYEQWKGDLVAMVDRLNRRQAPVVLWDFSGFSEITSEPLPRSGDQMRWYWEPSHYKKELGTRILEVLFGGERAPGGFGLQLSRTNLQSVLASQRRGRGAFAARHPGYVAEISAEVTAAGKVPPGSGPAP